MQTAFNRTMLDASSAAQNMATSANGTLSKIIAITTEMQNLASESQAYKNYLIELESYKQEAWGYQQTWAEAQQAINDINLSKIEHVGTLLGYQSNQ